MAGIIMVQQSACIPPSTSTPMTDACHVGSTVSSRFDMPAKTYNKTTAAQSSTSIMRSSLTAMIISSDTASVMATLRATMLTMMHLTIKADTTACVEYIFWTTRRKDSSAQPSHH